MFDSFGIHLNESLMTDFNGHHMTQTKHPRCCLTYRCMLGLAKILNANIVVVDPPGDFSLELLPSVRCARHFCLKTLVIALFIC